MSIQQDPIEPEGNVNIIKRYHLWQDRLRVLRVMSALPQILGQNEEVQIAAGGQIGKGSEQTRVQGVEGGSSAAGMLNKLVALVPVAIFFLIMALFALIPPAGVGLVLGFPLGLAAAIYVSVRYLTPYFGAAIIVTNNRVMYVKRPMFGQEVRDFTFTEISSVVQDTGVTFGTITLQLSGSGITFTRIINDKALPIMNAIRENISRPQTVAIDPASLVQMATAVNPQQAAPAQLPETSSTMEELEKLASLHSRGILTDAEFETEKEKILRRR